MEISELRKKFIPAIEEILDICRISDHLVDKEKFQVYIATIWGNAVLEPGKSGLTEDHLELLHDFLNEEVSRIVGPDHTITDCYEFIVSKHGDESLARLQITQRHKEFLHYFARLILGREIEIN
jgi:hypothetical protein